MAHFKIVDGKGEVVAGLDNIAEEHAAFVASRIRWPHSPLKLAEHEGMTGTAPLRSTNKTEVYRALRLPEERRMARDEKLAALGFEEPSKEQRQENLAFNVDWPLALNAQFP